MSDRSHFWLRVASLAIIFAAEYGPRLWTATPPVALGAAARVAALAASP